MSKVNEPYKYKPAPSYMRDWDDIDDRGWLDTQGFALYSEEVRLAIKHLGTPTQSAVKRWVIARKDTWFLAALRGLQAAGTIKEIHSGSLTRWTATEPPKPKEKKVWSGYNNSAAPKPMPVPDGTVLYGAKSKR